MSKKKKGPSAEATSRFRKAWIRDQDYAKYGYDQCVEDEFGQRIVHYPRGKPSQGTNGRKKRKS